MTYEFLKDFERRMEWIGIVESIVYKSVNIYNKQKYKELFDHQEFINIVFSILCFIMEKSLMGGEDCDIKSITNFVQNLNWEYYKKDMDEEDIKEFVRYIVLDILQNGGESYAFSAMNYTQNKKQSINIRLIKDERSKIDGNKKITYMLTEQGYKFLFRTREIEDEMQIPMEQLWVKELIKRKHFRNAYEHTKNLLQHVLQQRKLIESFIESVKRNVCDVNVDEYEKLVNDTFRILEEQNSEFLNLEKSINEAEKQITETGFEAKEDDIKNIRLIKANLQKILSEHNKLFMKKQDVSDIYEEAIKSSIYMGIIERFDMEEVVLQRIEEDPKAVVNIHKVLRPLLMPDLSKQYSIMKAYDEQKIITDKEEQDENMNIEIVEDDSDNEEDIINEINNDYCEFVETLIDYILQKNNSLSLSDFMDIIKNNAPDKYRKYFVEDKSKMFYTTILQLYESSPIDFEEIINLSKKFIINLSREFNLEYVIQTIMLRNPEMLKLKEFRIDKLNGNPIQVRIKKDISDEMKIEECIEITNFIFSLEEK
ncbi:MAG TPA: hypothetical protein PK604_03770 [Acetivibrio clariflavus]|nr:hypothetical protein [Acetivibrio clariflavus]